jgi:hypothetical protein
MTEPAEKGELIYENVDTAPIVYFDIAPAHAATPHRAEGRTCSRRVHRQHELLPSHGRDWEERGAILSEIA